MLSIEIQSRGGDFSYDVISLEDYEENKPIKFDWLEEQFDLMGDCEVLADITEATVTVTLNSKTVLEEEVKKLIKLKIDKNFYKYWRKFSGAGEGKIGVVWYHDSECYWRKGWSEVNEFDASKLKISADGSPMQEKEDSAFGEIFISYGDTPPDEEDFESSPKSGYCGPYTYEPRKELEDND